MKSDDFKRKARHPGESRDPGLTHAFEINFKTWAPAFAGATFLFVLVHEPRPIFASETPGAMFLTMNPSPRMAALGSGGSAVENGACALFSNPAGSAGVPKRELFLLHSQGIVDQRLNSLAYVHPRGSSAFGLGFIRLSKGTIEGRSSDGTESGSFEASDMAIAGSFSKAITPRISAGVNLKAIEQKIADETARGWAVDVGSRFQTPIKNVKVGAAFSNIGPKMKFIERPYSLPSLFSMGLGYEAKAFSVASDVRYRFTGAKTYLSLGSEVRPLRSVATRFGYVTALGSSLSSSEGVQSEGFLRWDGFAAGLGLQVKSFQLDYAFVPHPLLTESHLFSVTTKF